MATLISCEITSASLLHLETKATICGEKSSSTMKPLVIVWLEMVRRKSKMLAFFSRLLSINWIIFFCVVVERKILTPCCGRTFNQSHLFSNGKKWLALFSFPSTFLQQSTPFFNAIHQIFSRFAFHRDRCNYLASRQLSLLAFRNWVLL